MPLRLKIALLVGIISMALVLTGGVYLYQSVSSSIRATIERSLVKKTDRVLAEVESGEIAFREGSSLTISKDQSVIQIYAPKGALLYTSQAAGTRSILGNNILKSKNPRVIVVSRFPLSTGRNSEMFYLERGVSTRGSPVVVAVGASMDQLLDSQRDLFGVLVTAAPLMVLLASIGAWFITRSILAPVETLRQEAESLLDGGSGRRLVVPDTADELALLAVTLNHFLQEHEASVESQRLFVAAASHELRSPLAALAAEIEVALMVDNDIAGLKEILQRSLARVAELTQLSNDLLLLAAGDEGKMHIDREHVKVEELAVEVLNECLPFATMQGFSLIVDLDPDLCLNADRSKFSKVLSNLVYNALFYSQGSVITLRSYRTDGFAILEVQDDGVGFPSEFIPQAFERFSRGARARPRVGGSGLGLSIAQMIVELHGGSIEVVNVSEGALVRIKIDVSGY